MKAVLQRVSRASVEVDSRTVGEIGLGLVILLGVEKGDTEKECQYLAQKSAEMRIFADEKGKMNRSVVEVGGSVLLISQFTLMAEWVKGRRPGFSRAAAPEEADRLYRYFADVLRAQGLNVEMGVFGAHMNVVLANDGPVTLVLEHQFA